MLVFVWLWEDCWQLSMVTRGRARPGCCLGGWYRQSDQEWRVARTVSFSSGQWQPTTPPILVGWLLKVIMVGLDKESWYHQGCQSTSLGLPCAPPPTDNRVVITHQQSLNSAHHDFHWGFSVGALHDLVCWGELIHPTLHSETHWVTSRTIKCTINDLGLVDTSRSLRIQCVPGASALAAGHSAVSPRMDVPCVWAEHHDPE